MQGLAGVDVSVAAGACVTVVQLITFDATSWSLFDQIQLTAWAQDPAPATAPAEVYQARQVQWPFPTDFVFADGFEDGTNGSWSATSP